MTKEQNISTEVEALFAEQLKNWPLASKNYEALKAVRSKTFRIDNRFDCRVQFNPGRIQSSAAKVDSRSLRERKCFLCSENLPQEQRGVAFASDYSVLVNPFPIFPRHLTIANLSHVDQRIANRYEDMLDVAKALPDFVIFYNGPKCGASAPDHMHFQAGNKGFLPLERDVRSLPRRVIVSREEISCYSLEDYARSCIVIEASDKASSARLFRRIYQAVEVENEEEPMMNLLVWYEASKWMSCIFLRKLHRPKCFFAEDEENMLISPASVDMGGVFILPQEKDFNKITAHDVKAILEEVSLSGDALMEVFRKIDL